ncbi:MAG: aminoglycoside phosphotransferase family protein [Clostridia bacterium]|nr:aminoglycoside phosphotransferase family protein [Clostridia bacterium]
MTKSIELQKILEKFGVAAEVELYGNGHINETYRTLSNDYILQKINTNIFKEPEKMMENISNVTSFLGEKLTAGGGDPNRETLTIIKTLDGKNCYRAEDGSVYRMYKFVSGTKAIESGAKKEDLFRAGQGFGRFQRLLGDFPADTLYETIADFHNTPKRVRDLEAAVSADIAGRRESVRAEINFAMECAGFASVVTDEMEKGTVPLRVTHNDTKINNILFDAKTGEAVCVIDLDTVMPGSMLYDFGDALRIGASTAAEDETNLDIVSFSSENFEYFAKGYFSEMKNVLTEKEIELLPFSAKLLTYECGIRFLTDYLNGDTYFRIHHEGHNLDRARNQFKLVRDIAEKEEELKAIIRTLMQE